MRLRGQVMGYLVLVVPIMLLFVGVAIDAGLFFSSQDHLDQATEAAALAGAVQISPNAYYDSGQVQLPAPGASDPVSTAVGDALAAQFPMPYTLVQCLGSPAVAFTGCSEPTGPNQVDYFVVQTPSEVTLYVWVAITNPFGGLLGSRLEVLHSVQSGTPEAAPQA